MTTYTSTSSEGTAATRNSAKETFAFAVWVANTDANIARNYYFGQRTTELRCTNWFSTLNTAEATAQKWMRDGYRVEIRAAIITNA